MTRESTRRRFRGAAAASLMVMSALAAPPSFAQRPAERPTGRSHALVIGVSSYAYEEPTLRFAQFDAQAVARQLQDRGYLVLTFTGAYVQRRNILQALDRLRSEVSSDDAFVLFLAGHWARDSERGGVYFLPWDSRLNELDLYAIRLEELLQRVSDIRTRRKLLLLDLCFAGDVMRNLRELPPSRTGGVRAPSEVRAARGAPHRELGAELARPVADAVMVLSGAAGSALESPTRANSVFTTALLEAFGTSRADADGDGQLGIVELTQFLTGRVSEISAASEMPQTTTCVRGESADLTWRVAALSDTPAAVAVERYVDRLGDWRQNGWIQLSTYLKIRALLDRWSGSERGGAPLTEQEHQTLAIVRGSLDDPSISGPDKFREQVVADSLERRLWVEFR